MHLDKKKSENWDMEKEHKEHLNNITGQIYV